MTTLFSPLRQRTFALLWSATLLSNLGFWFFDLTLGWLIAGLTQAPAVIAMVPAAGMIPQFLFSLPAGSLGDMIDRRTFLLAVQAAFVLTLLSFALLVALDWVSAWTVIGFAFLHGTLAAISAPTRQAILPSIVPSEQVHGAVMLSAIGYNGSRALGPMIGGLLLAWLGPASAVTIYAVTCLAVASALLRWRNIQETRDRPAVLRQSLEGLSYVFADREMRQSLLLTSCYFLCVAPLWAFAPLIAKSFAEGDSSLFGLFMMALGLGAVIGGFGRSAFADIRFATVLACGSLLCALALPTIGLTGSMALCLCGFFVAGLGWIAVSAGINAHMLLAAAPQFRSRVIAMVMIVFSGGLGLGSLGWGQFAQHFGLHATFAASSGALVALSLTALAFERRDRRRRPA